MDKRDSSTPNEDCWHSTIRESLQVTSGPFPDIRAGPGDEATSNGSYSGLGTRSGLHPLPLSIYLNYLCTGCSCFGGFKFLVLPSRRCPPPEKAWQYTLHHSQVTMQHTASTHLKRIVSLDSLLNLVLSLILHTYTSAAVSIIIKVTCELVTDI